MPTVYHYDRYGFFDAELEQQLDPLETAAQKKDVYLMPADSTTKKPTIKAGYTPKWSGSKWEQYADDKEVYGYTNNEDGTIEYYGAKHTAEELREAHPDIELTVTDTEPVSVNGIYWLSADDEGYIEAKTEADKEEAFIALDAQYNADKDRIRKAYQDATLYNDTALMAKLIKDLKALDAQYDADYEALIGEDGDDE